MRSLLHAFTKRRWRMLALLGVTALVLGAVSTPALARLPQEGAEGVYEEEPVAQAEWVMGTPLAHDGPVFPQGAGTVLMSDVWYTDAKGTGQPPAVGETWYGAVRATVLNPYRGDSAIEFVVKPPPNTSLAVSGSDKIKCLFVPARTEPPTEYDVTEDRTVCPATATQTAEGWSLGSRQVAKYSQFIIQFPLKSSAPLRGAAGPNGGDKLTVLVKPDNATTAEPFVFVDTTRPAGPVAQPETTPQLSAFLNCLWNNPNTPGPC